MRFKGDIIITDPCYIMKKQTKTDIGEKPNEKDYFPYGMDERKYPDAVKYIAEELSETEQELLNHILKVDPTYDITRVHTKYKSEMFDKAWEAYMNAYGEWEEKNADDWTKSNYGRNMEKLGFTTYMSRHTIYGDWSCTTYNTDTKEKIGKFCADAAMVGVFLLDEVLKYNPEFDWHITRPWTTTLIKDFDGEVNFVVEHVKGEYEEDTEFWSKGDVWEEDDLKVVGTGNINFVGTQTGL